MLMISTIAVAQVGDVEPKPILNSWGMTAPFLLSRLPVWIFCVLGGVGAIFVVTMLISVVIRKNSTHY